MHLKDFLFTPIVLVLIYLLAYFLRPTLTSNLTKKYFVPALTFKIIGAISVGLIYHYFYKYGDTLRYHFFSEIFHTTFWDDAYTGIKLFFTPYDSTNYSVSYVLTDNYFYKRDVGGFFMLKVSALLGLFNMHSYYAISCLFAFISFFGLWKFYQVVIEIYPRLYKQAFIAIFCFPSVIFWGSGILKDTITLSALCWATYCCYELFIQKRLSILNVIILLVSAWILIILKIYILICFIPAIIYWIVYTHLNKVKNPVLRALIAPFVLSVFVLSAYVLVTNISKYNEKYSLENIEDTMRITANWITYTSGDSGSAYSLGDNFELTLSNIITKLPAGINVTLFRPYIWEIKNSVMLFASLESMLLLFFTIYVLYKTRVINFFRIVYKNPFPKFLLIYSLTFSFAVGITTYNFGTLVRYKIPAMPFYLLLLFLVLHVHNERKSERANELLSDKIQ